MSLRCPHEVIMAASTDDSSPQPPSMPIPQQLTCKHCLKLFDPSTGGKCTECKNGVNYCSRACQVYNIIIDKGGKDINQVIKN